MCDSRTFVYGKAVGGDNFTDRVEETNRLKMNFEAGINSIIISPRRIGKTPDFINAPPKLKIVAS